MTDYNRDLWYEARKSHQPNRVLELARNVIQSLPGRPARQTFAALNLGRENAAIAVDLNKYRDKRNIKAFIDMGVDIFILRIGGPGRWYDGDWQYTQDATYRPYLEQCDKYGVLNRTIGYIVHNPFESWSINGATGETIHTELIDDWTSGGYMPQAFCYDHEVGKCWRGSAEITVTNTNVVRSLAENTQNTWTKFRRMVGIYTARWFLNTYGPVEHQTYFDNINKPESAGGPGKQRPMWYAWYPSTFTKTYGNAQDALTDLLVPSGEQTGKFLQMGSYSLADLWQFTDRLKLSGVMLDGSADTTGVDASVSLGSLSEVCAAFGLGITTPPPPVDPPDPPTGDYATRAELAALAANVAEIETKLAAAKAAL